MGITCQPLYSSSSPPLPSPQVGVWSKEQHVNLGDLSILNLNTFFSEKSTGTNKGQTFKSETNSQQCSCFLSFQQHLRFQNQCKYNFALQSNLCIQDNSQSCVIFPARGLKLIKKQIENYACQVNHSLFNKPNSDHQTLLENALKLAFYKQPTSSAS